MADSAKSTMINSGSSNGTGIGSGGGGSPSHAIQPGGKVSALPVRIKQILSTDEGKLKLCLESEVLTEETVRQVQGLLRLQTGLVLVDFDPAQPSLFD